MSQETNDRKHLTPRQIINRYRKGEYVDESIEAISSAISSCGKTFDCIAVPFPTTIIEKVFENIGLVKILYERQKKGRSIIDITIPDYPQLKDILIDLSTPVLWESMQEGNLAPTFINILRERGMVGKYHLDTGTESCTKVVSFLTYTYKNAIEQVGLSFTILEIALDMMVK